MGWREEGHVVVLSSGCHLGQQHSLPAPCPKLADLNVAVSGQCPGHNCLDVHHCAARYRGRGRFAFVHTDDLKRPPWKPDGAFKRPLPDTPERMRLIEVVGGPRGGDEHA